MDATFVQWGLTISTKKTKVLVVGKDVAEQSPNAVITIKGVLEVVSQVKYLGSSVCHQSEHASYVFELGNNLQHFPPDGDDPMMDTEIAHRVANASSASAMLDQAKALSTKLQFLQTIVMTVSVVVRW